MDVNDDKVTKPWATKNDALTRSVVRFFKGKSREAKLLVEIVGEALFEAGGLLHASRQPRRLKLASIKEIGSSS